MLRRVTTVAVRSAAAAARRHVATKRLGVDDLLRMQQALRASSPSEIAAWIDDMDSQTKTRLTEGMFGSLRDNQRRELSSLFKDVDVNNDGVISSQEFGAWYLAQQAKTPAATSAVAQPTQPSRQQLMALGLRHLVPMIGFGFVDNFIMIIAGESIDNSLGSTLHISTMAAAGLGNMVSDVLGLGLSSSIEAWSGRLGLPDPKLTMAQHKHTNSRRVITLASIVGIVIGCILGMVPLLLIDTRKKETRVLFDELDVGNKGYLTKGDLATALRDSAQLPEESIQSVLTELKLSSEERIDFKRFSELLKKVHHNRQQ